MSNRSARRTKSPAARNKFSEVGVAGRKTGVRVTGAVPVDSDGLENVAEFYKHTSPLAATEPPKPLSTTLHTLVSPTPIRSATQYDSLLGALDMPFEDTEDAQLEDEALVTPVKMRVPRPMVASPSKAARRVTMAGSAGQEWVMQAKKGRRATMALMAVERRAAGEELDFGVEQEEEQEQEQEQEDVFAIGEAETEEPEQSDDAEQQEEAADASDEPQHVDEPQPDLDDDGFRLDDAEPEHYEEEAEPEHYEEDADADQQAAEAPNHHADDEAQPSEQRPRAQKKTKRAASQPPDAIRRSTRATVPPVAYWRNEHVEYSYEPTDAHVAVPVVKNVVRVRQTAEEKQQAKKRRTKRAQLPSLRNIGRHELDLASRRGAFYYYDDEHYGFPVDSSGRYGPKYTEQADGRHSGKRSLDDADDNDDIAVDERPKRVMAPGGVEEAREIALSRQSIQWANIDAKKDRFKVGVGLLVERDDGEVHASSGVLSIAVGGRKPPRNSGPRALFYLVTSGQVEVRVHGAEFRVGVLGQFLVPTHNTYSIANVGTHPAQLFYVHVCPPERPAVEEEAAAASGSNGAAGDTAADGEESAGESEIE